MDIKQNILTKEFYDNLIVVIYNGPPETLYGKYVGFVPTEDGICLAIKKCAFAFELFKHIINPSEKVILSYVDKYGPGGLKNPSKKVILHAINKYPGYLVGFEDMFEEKEFLEMIKKNPFVIKYIPNPTYAMLKLCVSLNGFTIVYIEKELQTMELCKISITEIYTNRRNDFFFGKNLIECLAYFDDEIVDMIIAIKNIVIGFNHIPKKFITIERFEKAFETNHDVIELSKNLPSEFVTKEMADTVKKHKMQKYYQYIVKYFEKSELKEIFDNMFMIDYRDIRNIPEEFQDYKMCHRASNEDYYLLEFCYHIDKKILSDIFKKMTNTPKKTRFKFINNFNEDAIIRLITVDERLILALEEGKMTHKLIHEMLKSNGYNLQYVKNQTQEYVKIALSNQPKAEKYVKRQETQ